MPMKKKKNAQMNHNFFKVYLPSLSSERLKIPTSFSIHLKRETSETSFLTGPSGKVWTVSLTHNSDGYFFEEGWPAFVRDHLLKLGDFCVFTYEGNSNFTVLIFDPSTCEKESAFNAICSQDCTSSRGDKGKKIGSNGAVKVSNASICDSRQGLSKKKANRAASVTRVADLLSGSIISQRRDVREEEKEKAFEEAMEFESRNPFTVIVMRSSYVYTGRILPMPVSFMFRLPDTAKVLILWDPSGKAWPVSYTVSHVGPYLRGSLVGGWNAFSYHNNVEEDDACVFELIRENEIQVHIFRVVKKVTPLIKHSTRKSRDNK